MSSCRTIGHHIVHEPMRLYASPAFSSIWILKSYWLLRPNRWLLDISEWRDIFEIPCDVKVLQYFLNELQTIFCDDFIRNPKLAEDVLSYKVPKGKINRIDKCLSFYPFIVLVSDEEDGPFTFSVRRGKLSDYVHSPFTEWPWRRYPMPKFCLCIM